MAFSVVYIREREREGGGGGVSVGVVNLLQHSRKTHLVMFSLIMM